MSEEQKISAVVCYDEDTGGVDITLFDNAEAARDCYLAKSKLYSKAAIKYKLPVHQKFIGCEATKLDIGDEVTIISKYSSKPITGIVVEINKINKSFDILVRKDCRSECATSVVSYIDIPCITILKTGYNLYSVANYVSYKEE